MINSSQIRAARALLGIDRDELSRASGVAVETIKSIEAPGVDAGGNADLLALVQALEELGVVFIASGDCPDGGEGLRLKMRHDAEEGIRPENLNATNDD